MDDQMLVIRAPAGTKLEVPDPDEGMEPGKRRYQIFLKSSDPHIELYIVPHAIPPPPAAAPVTAQSPNPKQVVRLDQPEQDEVAPEVGVADYFADDPTLFSSTS